MQMLLWWSIPSSKQTPILLFLYTPVKAQHTALIYELARLVSARVYWSLIYGCQHSSFNVSWRHASLLWRWHVVSSLLLMEFGVTDLRGLWRRDCGIFSVSFRERRDSSAVRPFALGRHLKTKTLRISSKQTLPSIKRDRRVWRCVQQ